MSEAINHIVVDDESNEVVNVILLEPEMVFAVPGHSVTPQPEGVGIGWRRVPGETVSYVKSNEPVADLAQLKAMRRILINQSFAARYQVLTEGYPQGEKETWPDQKSEVLAWAADPAAATPYLDGIAAQRQMDVQEFRQRTLAKVRLFTAVSQVLVGRRQRYEDQIDAAQSAEALDLIVWEDDEPPVHGEA
ncbi:hypothetical protein [Bordetella hinzii]|jgi:hypothetical protein|uniref:hypothetical protein n=1 Tax=Bordetella hinzii TaxID=103855 RepID=UPI00045A8633|nr:hypothetical protein [Bordetella hinzii]KCB48669.1 hypothetical protein L538_3041 [Bordetella hinzii 4161]KXA71684.1 hypothetical protein AXA74_16885 [Bordetella hinzii LMG 13501]QDJ37927.1 hypothetical protein CBR67_15335 [Bordetella hinzii]VEH25050.1 Uncharacterised protein [Bordetella hinzii]